MRSSGRAFQTIDPEGTYADLNRALGRSVSADTVRGFQTGGDHGIEVGRAHWFDQGAICRRGAGATSGRGRTGDRHAREPPPGPTSAPPGSAAKLLAMTARFCCGWHLYHPEDAAGWDRDTKTRTGLLTLVRRVRRRADQVE